MSNWHGWVGQDPNILSRMQVALDTERAAHEATKAELQAAITILNKQSEDLLRDWENQRRDLLSRAERAEAELQALREAVKPFDDQLTAFVSSFDEKPSAFERVTPETPVNIRVTAGQLYALRAPFGFGSASPEKTHDAGR